MEAAKSYRLDLVSRKERGFLTN